MRKVKNMDRKVFLERCIDIFADYIAELNEISGYVITHTLKGLRFPGLTVCSKKGYNTIITEERTADLLYGGSEVRQLIQAAGRIQKLGMIAPSGPVMPFLLYENPRRQLLAAGAFLHIRTQNSSKRRNER